MSILELKTCSGCKKKLEKTKFYKNGNGLRSKCKECCSQRNKTYYTTNKEKVKNTSKNWYLNNKDKVKNTKTKRKFGITTQEKNILFAIQGYCCAICKSKTNTRGREWDVDHCHKTGKVRGILCSNCNRGLGLFQDNAMYLLTASQYLQKT
jgi:hypothetical protein